MNQTSSIQQVTSDILDLCELQMQLLSVDSQAAKRKLARAVVCSLVGVTLAGSAITVMTAGLGLLLSEFTVLSTGGAMIVVSLVVLVIVALLLVLAAFAVKSAAASMSETKSEFAENLRWLKATLVSPTSSPRNQMRGENFTGQSANGASESTPTPVSPLPRR